MTAPAAVRCEKCHRRLTDPAYIARRTGRVCGGPILAGHAAPARRPVVPSPRGLRDVPDQLAFDLDDEISDEGGEGL